MATFPDFSTWSRAEMQRWVALLGIRGTFGCWTVCKNGRLRERRCSDMEGYLNDASREPNRLNGTDFGYTSAIGKALRHALPGLLQPYGTPALRGRFTGALRRIVDLDTTRPRGQRRLEAAHLATLKGFSFNPAAPVPANLRPGCTLTHVLLDGTLALSLPKLPPTPTYGVPARATHYGLSVGFTLLDPATSTARAVELTGIPSPHPLHAPAPAPAALPPAQCLAFNAAPTSTELAIIVIGLCYYELRAGQLVPLPTSTAPLAIAYAGTIAPRPRVIKPAHQSLRTLRRWPKRPDYPAAISPVSISHFRWSKHRIPGRTSSESLRLIRLRHCLLPNLVVARERAARLAPDGRCYRRTVSD